jgi:hypothetical protein
MDLHDDGSCEYAEAAWFGPDLMVAWLIEYMDFMVLEGWEEFADPGTAAGSVIDNMHDMRDTQSYFPVEEYPILGKLWPHQLETLLTVAARRLGGQI